MIKVDQPRVTLSNGQIVRKINELVTKAELLKGAPGRWLRGL